MGLGQKGEEQGVSDLIKKTERGVCVSRSALIRDLLLLQQMGMHRLGAEQDASCLCPCTWELEIAGPRIQG